MFSFSFLVERIRFQGKKWRFPEVATGGLLCKEVSLEITQNSQKYTYVGVSFLIKLRVSDL